MNEKKQTWKIILLSSAVCVLSMVPALLCWGKLPNELPIHFNFQGTADQWAPKWAAVLGLPLGLGLLNVFVLWATLLHDDTLNNKIRTLCIGLVPTITWAVMLMLLMVWMQVPISINRIACLLLGFLFVVMGNYLPKAGRNRFFGLRLKATLDSEVVWNKSNRLAGYLMLLAGILILFEVVLLPADILPFAALIEILAASLIPIVYAELLYHKEKKSQ